MRGQAGGLTMNKNKVSVYAILGILFVLISVIVFAIPTSKTGAFWIAYGFTVIAFVAQSIVWKTTIQEGSLDSKFLGISRVYLSTVYLVVQIIALAVFTAIPSAPMWSAIVVCVLILGIAAICMIVAKEGYGKIRNIDDKVAKKTSFVKNLQTEIELLAEAETDQETKAALMQLAEKVRYSDPMSSDELADIEQKILNLVSKLSGESDKINEIGEIAILLTERNKRCK
jgi:glucan phosphoethanolaminetransferase (alkaline phosphatase superfamily)